MPSVLIVDDDDGIRMSLRLALQDQGYDVTEAADGESALRQVDEAPPDAVLLDLMLPGMDGFECCRRIRESSDIPVLIVSARNDSEDVVAGLEAGADDYVRKPFDVPELTARLRALRRRPRHNAEGTEPEVLQAAGITLSPRQGDVTVDDRPVHLTKTEFRLLHELLAAAGRVVSREALLERVWEYDYFGDVRIVDVHVRRLRTKIEDDTSEPRRLLTVRGFGYKIDG